MWQEQSSKASYHAGVISIGIFGFRGQIRWYWLWLHLWMGGVCWGSWCIIDAPLPTNGNKLYRSSYWQTFLNMKRLMDLWKHHATVVHKYRLGSGTFGDFCSRCSFHLPDHLFSWFSDFNFSFTLEWMILLIAPCFLMLLYLPLSQPPWTQLNETGSEGTATFKACGTE